MTIFFARLRGTRPSSSSRHPAAGPAVAIGGLPADKGQRLIGLRLVDVLRGVGWRQVDEGGKIGISGQGGKMLDAVACAVDEARQVRDEAIALVEEGHPFPGCGQRQPQLVRGRLPLPAMAQGIGRNASQQCFVGMGPGHALGTASCPARRSWRCAPQAIPRPRHRRWVDRPRTRATRASGPAPGCSRRSAWDRCVRESRSGAGNRGPARPRIARPRPASSATAWHARAGRCWLRWLGHAPASTRVAPLSWWRCRRALVAPRRAGSGAGPAGIAVRRAPLWLPPAHRD